MLVDIQKPLKKFIPLLLKDKAENLNEADTSTHIVEFLKTVLGYNVLSEITKEQAKGGGKIDLAIQIDGVVQFLIEVKKAGAKLNEQHLRQTRQYALDEGIPWAVLTNGVTWELYRISFDGATQCDRVFSVDLAKDSADQASSLLGLLHRKSIRRKKLEAYWKEVAALSPESVARALFQEDVLRMIRRKIKAHKATVVGVTELASAIHAMFTTASQLRIGPPKVIGRKSGQRVHGTKAATPAGAAVAVHPEIDG